MTGLRVCCSSSTRGSRANDCIIRLAPSGAGQATPSQPARVLTASLALLPQVLDEQYPRSPVTIPIITRNSQIRDIFTKFVPHSSHWTAVAAILFLEIQWALPPPLYLNKSNRTDCTKWGHKLTCWIRCMCLQDSSPCVDLCFIPNELL